MQKAVDAGSKVIVIASSTGGTEVLEKIFRRLTTDIHPVLVVQHMPSGFTKLFANRLNHVCQPEIKEAENADYVKRGQILIAPADFHMKVIQRNGKLAVECFAGTRINGLMPAADILFDSVAELVKDKALGIVLTGMGVDGAKGALKMHMNGARILGQTKESCVVYGMPKAAKDLGAVDAEMSPDKITEEILHY